MTEKEPSLEGSFSVSASEFDLPPRLAPGTKLLGRYEDAGFAEPAFLVARADGAMVSVSYRLRCLLERIDGKRGICELAGELSERWGQKVDNAGVRYLIEAKLRPLGLMAGSEAPAKSTSPLLRLSCVVGMVPAQVVRRVAGPLRRLFQPRVLTGMAVGLIVLHLWLLVFDRSWLAAGVPNEPSTVLVLVGIALLSAFFHEFGHAAASIYSGAVPGPIGMGIFIVWPAFFTEVTDSYRLGRSGRVRVDLGGVCFNLWLVLLFGQLYVFTGADLWLWALLIQYLIMVQQMLPFLRLDGYYLVSDLTGVPDLFRYLRPSLASLVPGRRADRIVRDLRPGIRFAVTVWAAGAAAALGYLLFSISSSVPSILRTGVEMTAASTALAVDSFSAWRFSLGIAAVVHAALLVVQTVGICVLAARLSLRAGRGVGRLLEGSSRLSAVCWRGRNRRRPKFMRSWARGRRENCSADRDDGPGGPFAGLGTGRRWRSRSSGGDAQRVGPSGRGDDQGSPSPTLL
ncbi:MAG: hypothetical protein WD602_02930 [Actinomycetota bacterium]